MKAYKKQMYLNLAITVAAVGCACLVLMVCTTSPELRALDADNGYYAHTSYRQRSAAGDTWNMPAVSTTAPRATAHVARTSAAATPTTSAATQSLVRHTFGTAGSSGSGSGSSYAGSMARSQTVSMSPVTSISLNAIRRSTGTQVAATTSGITEPFSDPQRPQGEIRPRVVNEGPDEPFYEPLGDGLWFWLLCSGLFMLRTAIATKMRKSPPAP